MSKMRQKMDILLPDDLELLLREINEFCNSNSARMDDVPQSLENYLQYVAKTGNTVFPWQHVRPLFKHKLNTAIGLFHGESSSNEPCVHERFDLFRSAPFTIQRLAELIIQPQKHYKTKEKFVYALEKTVFVVSTVEPKSPLDNDVTNGKEDDLDNENLDETEAMAYEESDHQHHQDIQLGSYIPAMSVGNDQPTRDMSEVFVTIGHGTTSEPGPVIVSSSLDSRNILPTGSGERHHDNFETSYVSEMLKLPPADVPIPVEAVHESLEYVEEPRQHHDIETSHVKLSAGNDQPVRDMSEVFVTIGHGHETTSEPGPVIVSSSLDSRNILPSGSGDSHHDNFETAYVSEMLKLPPVDAPISVEAVQESLDYDEEPSQHHNIEISHVEASVRNDEPARDMNEEFVTIGHGHETTSEPGPVIVSSSLDSHNILPGGGGDIRHDNFETSYVSEMLKLPPADPPIPVEPVHDSLDYVEEPRQHHNIEISRIEVGTMDSTSADIAELPSVVTDVAEEPSSSTTVVSNLDKPAQDPPLDWTHLTSTS